MDMSEKRQRKRVPNFTADEKTLLTKLINNRKHIIECKMTDGKTVTKKKLAWEAVALEFNTQMGAPKRDTITLKRAWDNMKAVSRKARASEKGSLNNSESDTTLPTQLQQTGTMNTVKIEEASPSLVCEVEVNPYDSDAMASMIEPAEPQMFAMSSKRSNESPRSQSPSHSIENGCENQDDTVMSQQNEKGENSFNDFLPTTRKASDFIRREAALRVRLLETTKKYDMQILELKLDREKKENERATLLLEAARLEVEYQKRRLDQFLQ